MIITDQPDDKTEFSIYKDMKKPNVAPPLIKSVLFNLLCFKKVSSMVLVSG